MLKRKKHILASIVDQGLYSITTFLVAIMFARSNPIELFGEFMILMTVVIGVLLLQHSLVTQPLNIIAGSVKKKNGELFQWHLRIFWNTQVGYIPVYIFTLFAINLVTSYFFEVVYSTQFMLFFFLFIILRLNLEFFRRLFYTNQKIRQLVIISVIFNSVTILGVSWLFYKGSLTLYNVFFVYMMSSGFASIFALYQIQNKDIFKVKFKYIYRGLGASWKLGGYLLLSNAVSFFSNRAYLIIVAFATSGTIIGVYSAFINIIGVFNPLMLTISNYYLPIASHVSANNSSDLDKLVRKVNFLFLPILSIFIFLIYLYSYELLFFLYGDSFAEYHQSLRGFSLILILIYLSNIYQLRFQSIRKIKKIFHANLMSLLILSTLGVYMASQYGLNGIIFSQLLAWVVGIFLLHYYWTKRK